MKTRLFLLLAAAALLASISNSALALTVPVLQNTYSSAKTGVSASNQPSFGVLDRESGKATGLTVANHPTYDQVALLQFALSSTNVVPATINAANVKSVILELYVVSAAQRGGMNIREVTSPWSATFLTQEEPVPTISAPSVGMISEANVPLKGFVSVDITAAAVAALQSGSDLSIAIETENPGASMVLGSLEDPSVGYAAYLDIEAGLAGTSGTGSSGDPGQLTELNTAIGASALDNITFGSENTAIGYQALISDTSGSFNVANGATALYSNLGGSENTATGYDALYDNTSASFNTADGYVALYNNSIGYSNVAVGAAALDSNTSGYLNTAIGTEALYGNTEGYQNLAAGDNALYSNTNGYFNTACGDETLRENTSGIDNTAIGVQSLYTNTTGTSNVAEGAFALYGNSTGYENVANGVSALQSNRDGFQNVADGYQALYSDTAGYQNTAVGCQALYSNGGGEGDQNTAVGYQALYNCINDNGNTATGYQALYSYTTNANQYLGGANVADGDGALYSDTNGFFNTAVGASALFANTSGVDNTAVGIDALGANKTGYSNVAIGANALEECSSGFNDIGIGYSAGTVLQTGSNDVYIAGGYDSDESNTIRLGEVQTATYIAGISGTAVSGNAVYISSDGQLGLQASSRRFKQNIKPMGDASDVLLSLTPVTFQYKPGMDPKGTPQFGLVAEDVAKISPQLVINGRDGKPYSVRYDAVNAMLLNEFLKEHRRVLDLVRTTAAQEETNAGLAKRIAAQERTNAAETQTIAAQQKQIEALTASLAIMTRQINAVAQRVNGADYQPAANRIVSGPGD